MYHHTRNTTPQKLRKMAFNMDGVCILDEDWDTLIILDACRCNVFKHICSYPGELSKRRSLGTATYDVIKRNFRDRCANDVVYLSDNSMVGEVFKMDFLRYSSLLGLGVMKVYDRRLVRRIQ